jgi:hypothetical protein
VRDQTPLKTKGQISTAELRTEYRRAPALSILLDDGPLVACIRAGIERGDFVYQKGELVVGKSDPMPQVLIEENCYVHTMDHARKLGIWPRPEPKPAETEFPGVHVAVGGPSSRVGSGPSGPGTGTAPALDTFTEEGPLRGALVTIFEKARKSRVASFGAITIRLFDAKGTWQVQQSIASLQQVDVRVEYSMKMQADGMERFDVDFAGNMDRANTVKSLIEKPLQTAKNPPEFRGSFTLRFAKAPLATAPAAADPFIAQVTRFGAGEAFV